MVIERDEAAVVCANDCVLIHGDVGLHNPAVDPRSDAVNDFFDFDGAVLAHRHHDFRYLLFDDDREDMLNAALEICEPAAGRTVDRERIRLCNATCAVSFLAFSGHPCGPEIRWPNVAEDIDGYVQLSRNWRSDIVDEVAIQ